MTQGGKVTGERLAVSGTQRPGTSPKATGATSTSLTTHLPAPPALSSTSTSTSTSDDKRPHEIK